jgi:multicomponent Na+:H+ antiporter subunit D
VPPPSRAGIAKSEDELTDRGRAPLTTVVVSVALVALGLAWGLVPGLVDAATGASARFVDSRAYAAEVLRGAAASVPAPPGEGPSTASWLYGLASGALAIAVAALPRVPAGPLRDLHSGRVGDYVAWLATGAALVAGVFALTLG